jgi:parvulin-like peptidyl-prolyl isomerase
MRRASAWVGVWSGILVSALGGCESASEREVLAKVGSETLTLEQVRLFKEEMPALLRSAAQGQEEVRDYLQTMVDMKLMALEAREQGLGEEAQFERRRQRAWREKLVEEYLLREVWASVDIPADQVAERFGSSKWSRMLRLAHIRTESEAAAEKALQELRNGRPFAAVAAAYSIDRTTAGKGGAIEPLIGRGNLGLVGMPLRVADEVFALGAGEHSRILQMNDGYEIFRVAEVAPAPAWYLRVFSKVQHLEAFYERRSAAAAELAARYGAEVLPEAVALLADRAASTTARVPELSAEDGSTVLARYAGGQVTLADFLEVFQPTWFLRSGRLDRSGIEDYTREHLLPEALFFQAALEAPWSQEVGLRTWRERKHEAMLVEALRTSEVSERVTVDEASVRAYYESHLKQFIRPAQVEVREVLVSTRGEADSLAACIRRGQDMGALAEKHSTRRGGQRNHGLVTMRAFEKEVFGPLLEQGMSSPVGQLRGPLAVPGGYSVFMVLERAPEQPYAFAEAATRAEYWLRKQQEDELFGALVPRLREKHASRWRIFDQRVKAAQV